MKLPPLLRQGAASVATQAAGAAMGLNVVAAAGFILGAIYLADCRTTAITRSEIDSCYLFALPMMGVSAGVKGAYSVGYNTLNPNLKRPEEK